MNGNSNDLTLNKEKISPNELPDLKNFHDKEDLKNFIPDQNDVVNVSNEKKKIDGEMICILFFFIFFILF
jgi:hypothetical protein